MECGGAPPHSKTQATFIAFGIAATLLECGSVLPLLGETAERLFVRFYCLVVEWKAAEHRRTPRRKRPLLRSELRPRCWSAAVFCRFGGGPPNGYSFGFTA